MAYPANATFKHQAKSSRFWALLTIIPIKLVALVPHIILLYFVQTAAALAMFAGVILALFTGRYLKEIEEFVIGSMRWEWRVTAYLACMTDEYPPFTLKSENYPADLSFKYSGKTSRFWALLTIIPVKFVLLIPHIIVLFVLMVMATVCMILGIFATLFMEKFPKSFEGVITTFFRYQLRVNVYIMCLTDEYPPVHWDE